MIHGKSSAGIGAGASFDFGRCAGNQGTFTGRVEQISDWSLVAREPEEGKAYTFWARETKLDFLGLGDMGTHHLSGKTGGKQAFVHCVGGKDRESRKGIKVLSF